MHPLSIMLKPASSNCNMRCKYCFYFDETENREVKSYGFISNETTETLIKKALEFSVGHCSFMFQGGEPTLVGIDYYRNFVKLVDKHNTKKLHISYAIQTNGYLIDDEFAKFFQENGFLVGVSLDGTKELNDLNRIDVAGKSTYNKVIRAINSLEKHKVEFNILSVVTKQSCRNIEKTYNFLKKNRLYWHQYIACLDPMQDDRGTSPHSLTTKDYSNFLKKLFDIWYLDIKKGETISIRFFDDILLCLVQGRANSCGMQGMCTYHYVMEAGGEMYPCDFYMIDNYKIGNINQVDFAEIDENRKKLNFIERSTVHPDECKECKWYFLCKSGCMRDRENFKTGELEKTYLCEAYKEFYDYTYDRFVEIANMIKRRR